MANNDTVWVPVLPSFKDFAKNVGQGTKGAGKAAGEQIGKDLEAAVAKSEKAVLSAAGAAEKAQNRVADATGKVRIAQEQYNRALESGDPLKVARAEETLAKSRRDQVTATNTAETASKKLVSAQDDVARSAREQADAVSVGADSMGEMDGRASDLIRKLGPMAAGLAGVAGALGLMAEGFNVDSQITIMNQQLGLTGDAAVALGDEVGQVMRGGVAASAEVAAEAVGALTSQFSYLGFEGEQTAAGLADNFLAISQVFGTDMAEATQTAGQLITHGLATDVEQAADLMTTAMQRVPAAMREELPEILNEYGTNFASLGFDGKEAFDLLVSASAGGKIALDKTGDALKEFGIRATDLGDTAAVAAIEGLGLAGEDVQTRLLAGGATAREAFTQVTDALVGVTDPAKQAEMAIALFGTPLEDLDKTKLPAFLDSLNATGEGMSGFEGSSQALSDQISGSLAGRMDALKGTISDLAGNAFMALWDMVQNQVIPAFQAAGVWIQRNEAWVGPLAVAIGAAATAWGLWVGAIKLWQTVTKIATGVQLAFNAVMSANPIMLIVIAIAALVAGLVYFFTQTETGQRVWASFTGALLVGWEWVKAAFASAWAVISPILTGLWNVLKVVGAVLLTALVVPFQIGWALISAAMSFAWNTIIKPVFDALAATASWLWTAVLMPVFGWIKTGFQLVGAAFQWVWTALIKPAWDALGAGIAWVVNTVIMPIWNVMKMALDGLGIMFGWVWNSVIKPAWDALGAGIGWVWNTLVSPVFDAMKKGVDLVAQGFQFAADLIGKVWDTIKEKTAAPIRWVIDMVYNKGIVAVWNKVAGWLGMDDKTLDEMPLTFASGGVLPGYTPGRDVHKFVNPSNGQGLELSGGEAIMRPEWTRAVGGVSAVDRMNRDARMGRLPADERGALRSAHRHALGGVLAFAGGGVVPAMENIIGQKYPMLVPVYSGYRPSADNHGRGLAGDFSNGTANTPAMTALANDIATTYPNSMELIYESPGFDKQIKNGAYVGPGGGSYGFYAGAGNHANHVHWAMGVPPTMPFGGGVFEGGSDGGGGGRTGVIGGLVRAAMDKVMDPIMDLVPTGDGLIGGLGKGLTDKVYGTFKDWVLSKVPSGGGGGSSANGSWVGTPGVEQWRPLVEKLLKEKGHPLSLVGSVMRRMNQESGGNPNAINLWDSNAMAGWPTKGLLQTRDDTFMSNADPGFTDVWDPESNIRASMNYAVREYGSLSAAYDRAGGYDDGGWLMPGTTLGINETDKPEPVFTNPQWTLIKSLVISTAELLDPIRLMARDGRDAIAHLEAIADDTRRSVQHQIDSELGAAGAALWAALPGEVKDALTVAEAVGRQWEKVSGYLGEKALAWSKGEWPIGSGRTVDREAGPAWLAMHLDESLEKVARSNVELAEQVISGKVSPGNDPVANALFDIFGRDPLLPDLARIAALGPNAIEAATDAAMAAFETGETARLEEWTESNSQLTEAVLRARDAAILTGDMVQGAVNGYLNWAMASDSQGRQGSWQEYFQHYGGQYGTAQGDWLLGQVGLDGIIGGKFKDSFANLLIEAAESPLLSAPAILDDDGRVLGTQLDGATTGPAVPDDAAITPVPVTPMPTETVGLEAEASPAGTKVEVVIPDGKSALSIEEFKEILLRIDERLDDVEISIDGQADPAPLGLGVGGIA